MFFSGLLRYNSADNSFSSNLHLRWEYIPTPYRLWSTNSAESGDLTTVDNLTYNARAPSS